METSANTFAVRVGRSFLAVSRLAVVALLLSSAARAQSPVRTVDLANPKELSEPYTILAGVVELRDGRLLVADVEEKSVWLVDVTKDSRSPAARQGSGPTEFRMGTFLKSFADSAIFHDAMQQRLLVFSPAGAPVGTRPWGAGAGNPMLMFSTMQPSAVDASGRIYGQSMGIVMPSMAEIESIAMGGGIPRAKFADTVAVERMDPKSGRTDTLTLIRNTVAASPPTVEMAGGVMKMTMRMPDMRAADVWTVLPDGRVAVLRDGRYQVEFIAPNRAVTRGPSIPFTPVPVTAAEKKAMMDSARVAFAKVKEEMERTAGAVAATDMPKVEFEVLEPVTWAATKPAYGGIVASPEGRLWVSTPKAVAQTAALFDVLDGSGALVARVRIPAGEEFVALGRGVVYTTRKDADDFFYIRRYALPAPIGGR